MTYTLSSCTGLCESMTAPFELEALEDFIGHAAPTFIADQPTNISTA